MKQFLWILAWLSLAIGPFVLSDPNQTVRKHHHPTPTPTPTPTPVPKVTLAWTAPNDPSVQGYHLWIGFSSGSEIKQSDLGNVTTATINLQSWTTYFFEVTAYNMNGDSLPSNEVSYAAP